MSELEKALLDTLVYGTGIIEVEEDGIKHVPFERPELTYEKVETALKVFTDTAIEGNVVIFDEVSGETYQATIEKPKEMVTFTPGLPQNRKQRRIKASKDRRNGRNGRVSR